MMANQYDTKFSQLSRYVEGLIRNEADRTKKLVKGLKTEIRSKLITLQLKIYMQAVEKALEVEADMLEDSENRARETLSFTHPRYQGPLNWRIHNFRTDRNKGSNEILVQRSINLSWG